MLGFGPIGDGAIGALPEGGAGQASGFMPVNFGTPTATYDQTAAASGFLPINFGTPAATLGDPPAPDVIYSDTFDGVGTLSGHTPETGSAWITESGALSYWTLTGAGGVRRTLPKADDFARIRSQPALTLPAAGYVDVVFRIIDNGASADSHFKASLVNDALGIGLTAAVEHNVWNGTQWSEIRISSFSGGTHLAISDPGGLSSLALNTDYTVRIEWDGAAWSIYLDGALLGAATVFAPPPTSYVTLRQDLWAASTVSYEVRLVEIVESGVSPATQIGDASGFKPINFGTPTAIPDSVGAASGFMPVNFGTPVRFVEPIVCAASGFRPINFGTPATPTNRTFAASGFMPVKFPLYPPVPIIFGPVVSRRRTHAVGFMPVRFGTPTSE